MSKHSVVWLDHQEALIFKLQPELVESSKIAAPTHQDRHPKGGNEAHEHPADQQHFFGDVARALAESSAILLVGPGTAKLHFLRFAHKHKPELEQKIVAVETVDHPSDKQLIAYGKKYFATTD
jgi:stalled ribosome rescue protein Dom34